MSVTNIKHITIEEVDALWKKMKRPYARALKKHKTSNICTVVIPIIFTLLACLFTYFYFLKSVSLDDGKQPFVGWEALNNFFQPMMSPLNFEENAWYVSFLLCWVILMAVSLCLCILIRILVAIFAKPRLSDLPEYPLSRLRQMVTLFKKEDEHSPLIVGAYFIVCTVYGVFVAAVVVYSFYEIGDFSEQPLLCILSGLINGAFAWVASWLPFVTTGALCSVVCRTRSKKLKEAIDLLNKAISDEEKLLAHESEMQRIAEEQRQADLRRKMGEETYARATAGEVIDEDLMVQAANLGQPDACLYEGRKLAEKILYEPMTQKEKREYRTQAVSLLQVAALTHVEAEFLLINVRVRTDDVRNDEWDELYQKAKRIKDSGSLPEVWKDAMDDLIYKLIYESDAAAERERLSRVVTYVPTPVETTTSSTGNESGYTGANSTTAMPDPNGM